MMSKKDYQAIASVLSQNDPGVSTTTDPADTWRQIVEGLADVLQADNPRFERARFVRACEESF